MAFVHSKKSRLLVGDFSISAYTTNVDAGWKQNVLDTSTINDTSKQFIVDDEEGSFSASGYYDVAASTDFLAWKASDAPQPVMYGPSGFALGSEVWLQNVVLTSPKLGSARGQVAKFELAGQPTGRTDLGVSLHDLSAVTADESGTTYDGTAATSAGAVAHLHVTAFSGFSGAVVIVEDSANDSDWSTIGTFTTVAGATSERITISGTVRRYLRYSVDVTGTGSVTFAVGIARRA